MTVFVDSGFYIATVIRRDQHAKRAQEAEREKSTWITSSLVVNETVHFLQIKGALSAALHFLMEAERGSLGQIVYVDAALQAEAWRLFHKYGGAGSSPVDCVSFAIMNRFSIRRAFTFDRHFTSAGFEILK
jgi:uncharacterized protein